MVKIRLFDDEEVDKSEAFLALEKHKSGFAVVLRDRNGGAVGAPYVLFLEPAPETGKITLSLASSANEDYVERSGTPNETIKVTPSH